MRSSGVVWSLTLLTLVFFATPVSAEGVLGPAQAMEQARTRHAEGLAHYEREEFALALEAFMAAREAYPMAGFLFNIGQCHRNLGRHEQAISFFGRYLDQLPEADNRTVVEELMARSRQDLAQEAAEELDQQTVDEGGNTGAIDEGEEETTQEPLSGQLEAEAPRPVYRRWWFWTVLVGVVVAGAAVAGGTLYWANSNDPETILPEGSLGALDWRP